MIEDLLEVKPCPFCGGVNIMWSPPCNDAPEEDKLLNDYQVLCRCPGCYASGGVQGAIAAWNKRE